MNLHELKNLLDGEQTPQKDPSDIRVLFRSKTHPVMRTVRRQVIIEAIAWSSFLWLFYTAFDAGMKPLWVGFLVVAAVSAYLIHLVGGYSRVLATPANQPLAESLALVYHRMRHFAIRNLLLRCLLLVAVFFFFSYGINVTTAKYGAIGAIVVAFVAQLLVNRRLWFQRLRRLRSAIEGLTA